MLKNLLLLLIALLLGAPLAAQMGRAIVQEDYTIRTEKTDLPDRVMPRNNPIPQMAGFPKVTVAHPTFKNFRNVTLADLTNDGVPEILWATNHTLFVYNAQGLLWSKTLSGVAIYPPSVADMNQDGAPEIVQLTGGQNEQGRIYVLDKTGQDLPHFPLNFNNNWMLLAPALADVNKDGNMEIIACERVSPAGRIHIITLDGQSINEHFPFTLDKTPAVTPSIGDLNGDGTMEIVAASSESFYILSLDGQIISKISNPEGQRYSYQSPVLTDLDGDGKLEIIGAAHGNMPQFFVLNSDGSYRNGWPIPVPDNNWTYCTPSVAELGSDRAIIMSRPIGESTGDVIFGWDKDAHQLNGFPIIEDGGQEGIISVADVDDDGEMEVIFGSNLIGSDGYGFIHAYNLDGTSEVPGFPLRPRGWTIVNGANVGDVNGDHKMDLVVLSFTQNFGEGVDSVYLNVYELNVPYSPQRVRWSTYKGDNTRNGILDKQQTTAIRESDAALSVQMTLQNNPITDRAILHLRLMQTQNVALSLYDNAGKQIKKAFQGKLASGEHRLEVPTTTLPKGLYWLKLRTNDHAQTTTLKIIKM